MASTSTPSTGGQVCVVTGASSGLGESIAAMLAGRGACVTLCGRDPQRLQATLTLCVAASGGHAERFIVVTGDVTDTDSRAHIVQRTVQQWGRLDVLVANAGMNIPEAGILTATEDSYDRIMNTNVKSVFFLIQQCVPHLTAARGNIVVVSSVSSVVASSPNIVYPMSKAAIDHMVHCLAVDLGPRHVRVNAVNPSFIPTRIRREYAQDEAGCQKLVDNVLAMEIKKQPLGSEGVSREAVAEAVCFLCSAQAQFVTGQCLLVDAGRALAGPFGGMPE